MRWVCAGHLYQDMVGKVGSALAAPNLHKRMCARKAPAEDFGICAGYALESSLARLSTTTLNDLTTIHPLAKHIYLDITRRIGSRFIFPSVRTIKGGTQGKPLLMILGYAPSMRWVDFWLGSQ